MGSQVAKARDVFRRAEFLEPFFLIKLFKADHRKRLPLFLCWQSDKDFETDSASAQSGPSLSAAVSNTRWLVDTNSNQLSLFEQTNAGELGGILDIRMEAPP